MAASASRGTRHRIHAAVLAALWLGAAACGAPAPEAEPRPDTGPQLAGCWELEVTAEGAALDSVRTWLPAGTLPRVVELDTASLAGGGHAGEARAAYSWFDGHRETDPFSAWHRFDGDSVRVQRTGALAGLMLRLAPSDGELAGRVVRFTDVRDLAGGTARREAAVVARPVRCPG